MDFFGRTNRGDDGAGAGMGAVGGGILISGGCDVAIFAI